MIESDPAHKITDRACAGLHDVPAAAEDQAAFDETAGTIEQGGQAPRRCRRHLSLGSLHHPPHRRRPARCQRRMAVAASIHGRGGHGRDAQPAAHKRNTATSTKGRMSRGRRKPNDVLHYLDGRYHQIKVTHESLRRSQESRTVSSDCPRRAACPPCFVP